MSTSCGTATCNLEHLSINIEHQEVSEDFDFDNQSWTLITETVDGKQTKQQVALRRGRDDLFTLDRERLNLSGLMGLFACPQDLDESDALCIPCDVKDASCDFVFSMVREGAPYPAEAIEIRLSQWADEGSKFTLNASRR